MRAISGIRWTDPRSLAPKLGVEFPPGRHIICPNDGSPGSCHLTATRKDDCWTVMIQTRSGQALYLCHVSARDFEPDHLRLEVIPMPAPPPGFQVSDDGYVLYFAPGVELTLARNDSLWPDHNARRAFLTRVAVQLVAGEVEPW